ncbi:mandelate racemase/muconate lactonizing enzyme family protein [Roseivivax sp. CAU 1761]
MTVKISSVEVLCLKDPAGGFFRFEGSYQNVVVRVHGDNGLYGVGETDSPPEVIRAIIQMEGYNSLAQGLGDVLKGRSLDDPRTIWDEMYDATQWFGRHGAVIHAISALDIAIWDLYAKSEGLPLHAVLGRARREKLPAYATIYPMEASCEGITRQVGDLLDAGFRNIKFCVDPWWDDIELVHTNLRHLRRLVGPKTGLMLDVAQEFHRLQQLAPFLDLLEEIEVLWSEAPFPLGNVEDHVALKTRTRLPVGVGDLGFTTCREFSEYLERGALDIAQPDLSMFGGFSEALRLKKMLTRTDIRIVPHGYNTDITIAANLHFTAILEEASYIEYSTSPARLRRELCVGLPPIDGDGMIAIPQRPGLGVDLNDRFLKEMAHAHVAKLCS